MIERGRAINESIVKERDPLQDHCGVVGAFSSGDFLFLNHGVTGLQKLETRGHDGAGVFAVSSKDDVVLDHKGMGRVHEVFPPDFMEDYRKTEASMWIMQTRWGTNGDVNLPDASIQPIVRKHEDTGETVVVAHNGEFETEDRNGPVSDSILFADRLARSTGESWEERITSVLTENPDADDAYSLVIGTPDGMFLARDPRGYRPLSYGSYWGDSGDLVWVAASETHALLKMGIGEFTEVLPGNLVHFEKNKKPAVTQFAEGKPKHCLFETVYIERVNSKVNVPRITPDEINKAMTNGEARWRSGEIMALEAPLTSADVDLVVGIPGTAISGAKGFAAALDLPYDQVIHDIDPEDRKRTFLMADLAKIYGEVISGLYFDVEDIRGKNIGLFDDSSVRGNVLSAIVNYLVEECGVANIHARILCPPIDNICTHGLNTRVKEELVAARILMGLGEDISNEALVESMRKDLKIASLAFLSLGGLKEAAVGDPNADCFCTECMRPSQTGGTPVDFKNLPTTMKTS